LHLSCVAVLGDLDLEYPLDDFDLLSLDDSLLATGDLDRFLLTLGDLNLLTLDDLDLKYGDPDLLELGDFDLLALGDLDRLLALDDLGPTDDDPLLTLGDLDLPDGAETCLDFSNTSEFEGLSGSLCNILSAFFFNCWP
jgi:hypothetical protein